MKILFLQNMFDAIGGINNVTIALGKGFVDRKDEVYLYALRNGGYHTTVDYPTSFHTKLINPIDEWGCPRYSQALDMAKHGNLGNAIRHIVKRKRYDKQMHIDMETCKVQIEQLHPDVIIVTHYELFYAIPPAFYTRTISHFHTNFDQLLSNRGQVNIFHEFQDKFGKFVWLSDATKRRAIEFGISKSVAIYNPIGFSSNSVSSLDQKQIVFIGRFSKEKRLRLLISMFQEVIKEKQMMDWSLHIYGVNDLENDIYEIMENDDNIVFHGATSNPKEVLLHNSIFMMTSSFEGFPLVVIEANECGVPCIAFDFGETVTEVIHEDTGIIVPQDDITEYKNQLYLLMRDDQRRMQLGKQAKQFASSLEIDNIVKQWYHIFNELR